MKRQHAIERLTPAQVHGGECVACRAKASGQAPENLIALGMFLATIESMRKSLCRYCSEKIAEEFDRGERVARDMEIERLLHPGPPKLPLLPAAKKGRKR